MIPYGYLVKQVNAVCGLFIMLLISSKIRAANGLYCYVCDNADDNSLCLGSAHVQNCTDISTPTTNFDACKVSVSYTEKTGIQITKKCGIGPCHLDGGQNRALGLEECDRSGSQWSCESCCTSNFCNTDTASISTYSPQLLLIPLIICVFKLRLT